MASVSWSPHHRAPVWVPHRASGRPLVRLLTPRPPAASPVSTQCCSTRHYHSSRWHRRWHCHFVLAPYPIKQKTSCRNCKCPRTLKVIVKLITYIYNGIGIWFSEVTRIFKCYSSLCFQSQILKGRNQALQRLYEIYLEVPNAKVSS